MTCGFGTIGTAPEAVGTGCEGLTHRPQHRKGAGSMVAARKPDRNVRDRLAVKHYPHLLPLDSFPERYLARILDQVAGDKRPPRWLLLGPTDSPRPMARIESRGWYEWHLFRGIDPARRERVDKNVRAAVVRRDGYVCGICDGPVDPSDVHLDHIIPYSHGGPTTVENLRVTHSHCNIKRGNRGP